MLVTKKVKVKWWTTNKKYYEDKGYIFTAWRDEFDIDVNDLSHGSDTKVEVQCDGCGVMRIWEWKDYVKQVKMDGLTYCQKCGQNKFGTPQMIETKLSKSESFYEWCIKNDYNDVLSRWDYKQNTFTPKDISFASSRPVYLRCPKSLHGSEEFNISYFTSREKIGSITCSKCKSFAQWGIDSIDANFLEIYWDWGRNDVSPWDIGVGHNSHVWINCQEVSYHGSYNVFPVDFRLGVRCPFCANQQVHYKDSLGKTHKYALKIWSDKNKLSPYEYAPNSGRDVWWKCSSGVHADYIRDINSSYKKDFRCPTCSSERDESFLQEKVRLYLGELGYDTLHEYDGKLQCFNPKTERRLPYDNEIVELSLIVETHGLQHYQSTNGWYGGEDDFKRRKLYDRYKRVYAKSQGYHYLEIPYWTDNDNEEWKYLIDYKILTILSKI